MGIATFPHNPFPTGSLPFISNPSLPKPSKPLLKPYSSSSPIPISNSINPLPPLLSASRRLPNQPLPMDVVSQEQHHRTLLVETFHQNNNLRAILREISRKDSNPLRLLRRDGDWTKEQVWVVVSFLLEDGRVQEGLKVYDFWKNKEMSRVTVANYSKIIRLLCEGNFMEEAVLTFQDMVRHGLAPSLVIYNDIIYGFSSKKEFDNARAMLSKMVEAGILPTPETYNGLIRAYGSYGLYDEMYKCVKRMESEGCIPNEVTYNLLIGQLARGGLVERMEGAYRTLRSKHMNLQPHTLVMMLEAYADLGILEKMEKIYLRVLNSKAFMKESLIRKLALAYIENCRFSRLEELGNDISGRTGRTDLVWCILLLSSACLLSRKGIESIVREMEIANVRFCLTFTNVLGLFYLKIKDFRALDAVLFRSGKQNLKPDMITFGILFDACKIGYDNGTHMLELWRRNGYLEREVEIKTDPLVLAAFGKGFFIRNCEKLYSSIGFKAKEKKLWTYGDLITLFFGGNIAEKVENSRKGQLFQVEEG